ncbi:hypothetical protein [Methylobacterium sp. WSM2598]|uniref:hypothetical protein n=1 Tax=Methylobacterium sp. WSM2598 TaxID=398261 RepID=UPI0012F67AFB|nr:hypothetical protein [Methylobacterium sp. WSM2598]
MDDQNIDTLFQRLLPKFEAWLALHKPWKQNMTIPSTEICRVDPSAPFMQFSTCSARAFFHPEFQRISRLINVPLDFHRKYWEWVFLIHQAETAGVVGPGKRGLVFGVGQEPLPAVFAQKGCIITATDAPTDIAQSTGWSNSDQFAEALATLPAGTMDRAEFERSVEWRECEMNNIDPDFKDYDFCWSSCCLEHLGTLKAGMDFSKNSVVNTLKVGGVAIHTTEFNVSSNTNTVESGHTVIYRRQDLEQLIDDVRAMGHQMSDLKVAPDSLVIDNYVDTPPFSQFPHLKLMLEGYVSTSVGLVIRRMH